MNASAYTNNTITLLCLEGVGPANIRKCNDELAVDLSIQELQALTHKILGKSYSEHQIKLAKDLTKKTLDICDKNSIKILTESQLPTSLSGLKNPPAILYCLGSPPNDLDETTAVIGTRSPCNEAISATELISAQLVSNNSVIVSGLALGIDSIAQQYSVSKNKRTIAVIGSGLLNIYPPQNSGLAKSIIENQGCLLSEYAPNTSMQNYMLVSRDRIQAGIAKKLVLIQSKVDGGSMHATKEMMRLGRPVYFVNYDQGNISESDISGNLSLKNKLNCEELNYSDIISNKHIFTGIYKNISIKKQDSFDF